MQMVWGESCPGTAEKRKGDVLGKTRRIQSGTGRKTLNRTLDWGKRKKAGLSGGLHKGAGRKTSVVNLDASISGPETKRGGEYPH